MKNKLILLFPLVLTGCSGNSETRIIIGACSTPHAFILEQAKPIFDKKGYTLEIKVFNDYVTPNLSLDAGDLDANYFQHVPYLTDFNEKNGTDIVSVGAVHFEPMGIYSIKHTELKKGSKIVIPNDISNRDRAVELLTVNGYDLKKYEVIEAEAQTLPALLHDVDYAVINGNYALSSKITDKCIITESNESEIAKKNANVIAVKNGDQNKKWVTDLLESVINDEIKNYITATFGSAVIPMF